MPITNKKQKTKHDYLTGRKEKHDHVNWKELNKQCDAALARISARRGIAPPTVYERTLERYEGGAM